MPQADTTALAHELADVAIERHASDVLLIDLRGVVSYTDYFVVCTGGNARLTKAIADHVVEQMRERGHHRPRRRDADPDGSWLLLDYTDVIVHIFTPDARSFYRLESLWGQVPQTRIEDPAVPADGGDSAQEASVSQPQ